MRRLASFAMGLSTAGIVIGSPAHLRPVEKLSLPVVEAPAKLLPVIREFPISSEADWVAIAPDAIWTAGKHPDVLVRINPNTNRILEKVRLPGDACAGIAAGAGRVWVPICSGRLRFILAVDAASGRIIGRIPVGPGPEGGIAVGDGSVWFTIGDGSILMEVDERSLAVRRRIRLVAGSYNPVFTRGHIWITSVDKNLLTDVAARTGTIVAMSRVGPKPRFVTAGEGAIWTLNQGDGSVTRVNEASHRVMGTIPLGIPGPGGDIDFGGRTVWVTYPGVPLTSIDPARNRPITQWVGPGGDSLRFGHGSVWLTDLRRGKILRVAASARMWRR